MKKLFSVVMAVLLVVPLFAETFTVTKQVSEVASEGSWVTSTDTDVRYYPNFKLDKVVTITAKDATPQTSTTWNGVYYANATDATKSDWRMYQARNGGEFNFSVAIGYQLKSITLTYSNKNDGVVGLVSGSSIAAGNQVASGAKLSLGARVFSKTLYVGATSTNTNGQARITKFSVEYESVPVDTLYLNTGGSALWNQAGAKFSVWYWNDAEQGHFTDFLELANGETDIFRVIIPKSDSVIFVRHDAAAETPTWDNKWNQTKADEVDLEIGNIMVITGWEPADREWDYYTPKEPEPIKIYAKNNWDSGDWTWKEMKHDSTTIYSLDSVVYGGTGININTKPDDGDAMWFDANKMAYIADTIKENDTVKIVFNLADSTLNATLLSRPVPPCVDNFGLMIDGIYVPGVYNETSSEWTVLKQDLIAGQKLVMYSYCGETSFAPKQGNFADYMDVNGDTLTVKEDAEYDFYIQLISGNDKLWVVQHKSVTLPRITKAPKSWAGEYAIAAMANDTAIVWTGIDAGQCRDSIKLVDGNLVAQNPVMVVVEAMKDGGYSVKMKGGANDGKYITQNATPSYGNGLKFVDNPVRVDITMKDSLVDFFQTINTLKVYLLYNKTKGSSGERFRFYKDNNYGGSNYMSLTLFGTPAPSYDYDTVMYVAGNFTNWADGMKVLPDTVTMPEDSVLAFKQVRVITTKLGETVVKTDTAWFGQQNEGAYMTRENSKDGWTLNGEHNVLLKTDRAGEYVFSLDGESFKVKFPALPGYTYDTLYTIAGNFTNWAADMQAMPYEVKNVAKDSVLLYKVVRQLITYESGVETKRDTTWLGQPNEGNQMTRESNAWKLDGGENVKLTADEAGTYKFDFTPADSVLTVTFPALKPYLDSVNTIAHLKACYEAGTLKDLDTIKVKGYIASMFLKPTNFAKYGSVTIWMTDTLGGKAKEFELYNCYGLEKDTFAYFGPGYNTTGKSNIDIDTIIGRNNVRFVIGDYVEAVGAFKNYSGTFELVGGCNIYEGGEKLVRYAKNNWDATDWTWEEMTYVPQKNQFELNNVVYGGTGLNINTVADDADAVWIAEASFLGDKVQAKDTVSFVFNPSDSTLTATLVGRPAPQPKAYYITGNAALVGELAWNPKAITMTDSAHTFMAMAAGDYKMKITNGAWEPDGQSWGYANLSESSSEGISGDADGNICFTVETANNVVVSIANGVVTVTGSFKKSQPTTPSYGILVNGTYYAGEAKDIEGGKEYKVDIALVADDEVQMHDSINNASWIVEPEAEGYTDFTKDYTNQKYIITNAGQYQFYVKIYTNATSGLYVGYQSSPAAIMEVLSGNTELQKVILHNQLYILRNGVLYNVNGLRLR